jgi:predicted DCC family thiol-disulfide oxidoreductase YuxK
VDAPLVKHCREQTTVYYDGACPICAAEIRYYRNLDRRGALHLVDASKAEADLPANLDREQALARFHVLSGDGRLISGARAFAEIWSCLPGWRWVAKLAAVPGMLPIMETLYRGSLVLRPNLSRFVSRVTAGGKRHE